MFDIDLIAQYFPATGEIEEARLVKARTQAEAFLQERFTDIDMAPGTVFGERFVAAMAYGIAASEVAVGRVLSDLNLDNIANNLIYNCKFVEGYLGNFGVYDTNYQQTTGIVRLTFTDSGPRTLNRNFKLENDSFVFYPRIDDVRDEIYILPPGSPATDGGFNMTRVADALWEVDIPFQSEATTTPPVSGASFRVTVAVDGLVLAVAASDFFSTNAPSSLPTLAKLSRLTSVSVTPHNRQGTRSAILLRWPQTSFAFVAVAGDEELQRSAAAAGPLAVPVGCMDIIVASRGGLTTRDIQLRLIYDPTLKLFRGTVALDSPRVIRQVTHGSDLQTFRVFSRSGIEAEGLSYTQSAYESLWIEVEPELDNEGFPIVTRITDGDDTYGVFTVTVDYDPNFAEYVTRMTSDDFAPVGVDALVRHPHLALVDIEVTYRRTPGVRFLALAAEDKIRKYIDNLNYPDVFSTAEIARLMHLAGAAHVEDVEVTGTTYVSPASRKFDDLAEPNTEGLDWDTVSAAIPTVTVASVDDLTESHELLDIGVLNATPRNTQVVVSSITLTEI